MLEVFSKFLSFVGAIFDFFAKTFFEEPIYFFSRVLEAPLSSFYELIFVLFLLGVAASLAWGVVAGVVWHEAASASWSRSH